MAIYYYVRSPFSGTLKGQDCYCINCNNGSPCTDPGGFCTICGSSQCTHIAGIDNLCCPMDIFGAVNTAVALRTSAGIQSIRTTRTGPNDNGDLLCATAPPPALIWINEGVRVQLYTGTGGGGSLVGTVFYGHLKNRISNGVYNSPNLRTMGYLGDQLCSPSCPCYTAIHVHMARSSANNGYTYHHNCNYSLSTSSSVYRWFL